MGGVECASVDQGLVDCSKVTCCQKCYGAVHPGQDGMATPQLQTGDGPQPPRMLHSVSVLQLHEATREWTRESTAQSSSRGDRARLALGNHRDFVPEEKSGDERRRQDTRILQAARTGDFPKVAAAVSSRCDMNSRTKRGHSPLMLASQSASRGALPAVKFLLEACATVDQTDDDNWTALLHACRNSRENTTKLLLQWQASINARTSTGQSALMLAVFEQADHLVKALVSDKCDLHMKDIFGWTVLLYACADNRSTLVSWLLRHRATASDFGKDGISALMMTCKNGNCSLAEDLLRRRAAINSCDLNGKTALMYAVEGGKDAAGELLLEHKIDVFIKDNEGKDAADYADDVGLTRIYTKVMALSRKLQDEQEELQRKEGEEALLRARLAKKRAGRACKACEGSGIHDGKMCSRCKGTGLLEAAKGEAGEDTEGQPKSPASPKAGTSPKARAASPERASGGEHAAQGKTRSASADTANGGSSRQRSKRQTVAGGGIDLKALAAMVPPA